MPGTNRVIDFSALGGGTTRPFVFGKSSHWAPAEKTDRSFSIALNCIDRFPMDYKLFRDPVVIVFDLVVNFLRSFLIFFLVTRGPLN